MATVLKSFVRKNSNSFELFELWMGASLAPGQMEKDFPDAERFILSTMCGSEGIPLADEEENLIGCGGVNNPGVLPPEIKHWWQEVRD